MLFVSALCKYLSQKFSLHLTSLQNPDDSSFSHSCSDNPSSLLLHIHFCPIHLSCFAISSIFSPLMSQYFFHVSNHSSAILFYHFPLLSTQIIYLFLFSCFFVRCFILIQLLLLIVLFLHTFFFYVFFLPFHAPLSPLLVIVIQSSVCCMQ